MAKKPSSKRAKRPVSQSAAKGGGIMSLNKSNTSPFMKFVIILIIIAMVTLFLYGGIAGLIELFKTQPQSQAVSTDPIAQVKAEYEPRLTAFDAALASNPESFTLLVNTGNARFDYAMDLMKLVSQTSTAALQPAVDQWTAAKDVFAKAVKVNKEAPSGVRVDYSIALYYSGDTTEAIKVATAVVKKDPTFAPAFFNLGIFYEGLGDAELAVAAYQKYLTLDPDGKAGGNPEYAKQQLQALGATVAPSTGASATPITTGTP